MNHLKENTNGIDCTIKDMQTTLYDSLLKKWGEIEMYGRVYKNPRKKKMIPEFYDGERYIGDMYLDSKENGKVFFIDSDVHRNVDEGLFESKIKVVFILNLEKIYPDGRNDDKAQKDAFTSIQQDVFVDFDVTEIEKTINRVFSGFDVSQIQEDDMHPFHVFSINGNLKYNLTNNC